MKCQKLLKTCHLRLTQMYPTCLSGWNTSFRPNTNFSDFRGRSSRGRSIGTSSLREVGGLLQSTRSERGVMGRRCLREQAARGSGELCLPLVFRVRGADCPRRQDPVGMPFPLVGLWAFCEAAGWRLCGRPSSQPERAPVSLRRNPRLVSTVSVSVFCT